MQLNKNLKIIAIASVLILGVAAVPVPEIIPDLFRPARYYKPERPTAPTTRPQTVVSSLLRHLKISTLEMNTFYSAVSQGVNQDNRRKYPSSSAGEMERKLDRSGFMFREICVKNEALQILCCGYLGEFCETECGAPPA
ncbi:hypothetical protein B0H19DRAFT_1075537 [Mycena capillaripes]|nr:hypothetical protein B0H19DRAFT_1075537 [Mycena capillaripes]